MKPLLRIHAVILLLLLLPATVSAQLSLLDEYILGEMARENIPGLSVAVISGQETSIRSYGVRKNGSEELVNNETIFEAASLSKPVFALLVLELADRGILDLDRPVHEYVDQSGSFGAEFFESESYRQITPRMVLSHTSGLPNGTPTPGRIHFEPGSDFAYSGTGYRYLLAAVNKLTGQSLTALLDEYIFTPLAMHSSSFLWRQEFATNAAWGHSAAGEIEREILHLETEFPEGGLLTNINDYTKFLSHIIERYKAGDAVIRDMIAAVVTAQDYPDSGQMSWGLGWGIEQADQGHRIWHTGSNGPFKSFALVHPERASALLFFANAENGLEIIPGLLDKTLGASALSDYYQKTISDSRRY